MSTGGTLLGSSMVIIDIEGEQNLSSSGAIASIGGGNDNISIRNFVTSASGAAPFVGNIVQMNIFGDGDITSLPINDVTSTIGGGNDVISLANDDVVAQGTPPNAATILLFSDDQTQEGEAGTTVGQGDDDVTISHLLLQASTSSNMQLQTQKGDDSVDIHNSEFGGLGIGTGSGDDEVDILNSEWGGIGSITLEDGNDELKMNGNFFVATTADGGLGFDTLQVGNNTGVITALNFERINGMPSLPVVIIP